MRINMQKKICALTMLLAVLFIMTVSFNARAAEDTTWQNVYKYTVDAGAMEIKVTKYNGQETNVVVPGYAVIGGRKYDTLLSGAVFNKCSKIVSLSIEDGVAAEGSCANMFANCSKLKSLDVSKLDTSAVTRFNGMFNGSSQIKVLDLSNFDFSSFKGKNSKFIDAKFAGELHLPQSYVYFKNGRFRLGIEGSDKALKIHYYGTEEEWKSRRGKTFSPKVKVIFEPSGKTHSAYYGKTKGDKFVYRNLKYRITGSGDVECIGTTKKNLPKISVPQYAYDENEDRYEVGGIAAAAFKDNKNIRELNIDNSESSYYTVGFEAFKGCSSLSKVTLYCNVDGKITKYRNVGTSDDKDIEGEFDNNIQMSQSFEGTKPGIKVTVNEILNGTKQKNYDSIKKHNMGYELKWARMKKPKITLKYIKGDTEDDADEDGDE